jgi:hypothetical protein
MRGVGLVTLLSVGAVSAAPSSRPVAPGKIVSVESTHVFVDCWAERRLGVLAPFMRAKVGEAPSDFDAPGTGQTYFITISDGDTRRIIRLQGPAPTGPQAKSMEQCI